MYGFTVSSLNIGQIKGKCDLDKRDNYNKGADGSRSGNAYKCALSACAENSIYVVNEMLESCGYEPFGSSSLD